MAAHDELCPISESCHGLSGFTSAHTVRSGKCAVCGESCQCDLIRRAKKVERNFVYEEQRSGDGWMTAGQVFAFFDDVEATGYGKGVTATLDTVIEAVRVVYEADGELLSEDTVLNAITAAVQPSVTGGRPAE